MVTRNLKDFGKSADLHNSDDNYCKHSGKLDR